MDRIFFFCLLLGFGWCIGFGCIIALCIPNESFVGSSVQSADFWSVVHVGEHVFRCTNVTQQTEMKLVLFPTMYSSIYKTQTVPNCVYIPNQYFCFFYEKEWIVTCKPLVKTFLNHVKDEKYKTTLSYEDIYPYCPKRHIHGEMISFVLEEHIQCEINAPTCTVSNVVFFNGQEEGQKMDIIVAKKLTPHILFTESGIAKTI